jgi:hypothetical protein
MCTFCDHLTNQIQKYFIWVSCIRVTKAKLLSFLASYLSYTSLKKPLLSSIRFTDLRNETVPYVVMKVTSCFLSTWENLVSFPVSRFV